MDLANFTDVFGDEEEIENSQPLAPSLPSATVTHAATSSRFQRPIETYSRIERPPRRTGQAGDFRSVEEIDAKYRDVFTYPYFNLVQSGVIDDALYTDKSMVVCAPTGSGKTVIFEMAIVQLLMELDDKNYTGDFKIIYMAPVKSLCTERLSEWYPKFTRLGLMCIEVTGDTNVDFSQLQPYRIIITTPEKWDILTRRWRDHQSLVEVIKLFLIDEVHILNDEARGPVLEAVVSRMKTIESSSQSAYRIEQLQKQYQSNHDYGNTQIINKSSLPVQIRFVAVSATISNPEDVAAWLGASDKPAVYYKFGDECRPVKLKRVVEGYPCAEGTSIFKFDIILNYKLWPIIQKYHDGKPTLIFCNTRKSVQLTADTLSRELTVSVTPEQQAKLAALASTIKNKKLQALVVNGVGCHHAGLLYEERMNIEEAFRNRDLPILITTTTLAMGVNLPAHLVIIKNTQQYVNGAYQEYSISTVLQMVGRAGRPQFDTEATAVIMTRLQDKHRYQALVGGEEPLQSYLHKRLPENLNSEAALRTVCDVAQCVQWLRSTFLYVRAAKDPRRYLGLPQNAQPALISKKIEELCVKSMNGLATAGLITMDEASCIESTEAGRLMSVFYLDLETMKHIMKIEGSESLEQLLWIVCECHELSDMHLRMDERRTLNTLNRNNAAATIRFPMKGKISTRQMKLSCVIQAILGCLPIPDPSLNQEAMKVMRIADRVCKCLVTYITRPALVSSQPQYFTAAVNAVTLAKCIEAHLWENSPYVSRQLKGIGPTFSSLLATAGKVSFTLLEESHPRDLERIMNKNAPAGNVLRKQISFLPKYQLTTTPVDEKRITIQLLLLNHHQLAENREQLTAGDSHKCYIVVGDSENYLLLFTSFKDKDLINIYGGALSYEVTRKHNFEHKILIQCISSNWVGIDVQCDYLFKNIEPTFVRREAINPLPTQDLETPKKTAKKQTSITDVYKVRKRKNEEIGIAESKEKIKRDTALVEKFKLLRNSFEVTSKELKDDLDKSAQISNMIIENMRRSAKHNETDSRNDCLLDLVDTKNVDENNTFSLRDYEYSKIEKLDDDENFMVDNHINNIMNEIETEICKSNNENTMFKARININDIEMAALEQSQTNHNEESDFSHKTVSPKSADDNVRPYISGIYLNQTTNVKRKRKPINTKTNYSFIDTIEKNLKRDNYEEVPQSNGGFSDTIKNQIDKFLQRTAVTKRNDIAIQDLLDNDNHKIKESKINTIDELSPEGNYSVHNIIDKNDSKESSSISKLMPNIDTIVEVIERDYMSTKDSPNNKANSETLTDNIKLPDMAIVSYDQPGEGCNLILEKENNKTLEKIKNSIDENKSSVKQYYHEELPKDTIDKIMDASKEKIQNNDDALNERNLTNNSLVSENTFFNGDKSIEQLHKSISHQNEIHIDQEVRKVFKNEEICEQYLGCQNLQIWPQCFSPIPQHLELPDNFKKGSYKENKTASILQKNESGLQIPNNSVNSLNNSVSSRHVKFNQFSEDSTKSGETDNDNYINRYLYKAMKIDVCTRNMSDHQIQIIRKLKLDLDITEVVSKGNNKNTKEPQTNQQDTQRNSDIFRNAEQCQTNSKLVNVCQNVAKNEAEENKMYLPQMKFEANRYLPNISESLCSKTQKQYKEITDDIDKKKLPQVEETNSVKEVDSKNGDLEQYKRYLLEIAAANVVRTTDEKSKAILPEEISFDKDLETKNIDIKKEKNEINKIEDILKKYTLVLRKNDNVLKNDTANKNNFCQNKIQECKKKSTKPYKISDIHNLHNIPLPKSLIAVEASKRTLRSTEDKLDREVNTDLSTSGVSINQSNHEISNINTSACIENNLSEDIPDYLSPDTNDPLEENMDGYDLDQSMLNPKTLLEQCFPKNELNYDKEAIIPPPSEFCDDETYSPVAFQEDDIVDFTSEYKDKDYELVEPATIIHDESIFEKDNSVLTPSIEIETWTLSHDEHDMNDYYFKRQVHTPKPSTCNLEEYTNGECQSLARSQRNLKSFTVMRRNTPVNSRSQTFYQSSKLGHFKYTPKNKM